MKKILSKAQTDYQNAKQTFERCSRIMEIEVEKARMLRNEVTQAEMEKLVVETGFHAAYSDLLDAENELIKWSHSTIKHEKIYKENRQHFDNLFEQIPSNPQARQTVLDLAMRIR